MAGDSGADSLGLAAGELVFHAIFERGCHNKSPVAQ
jgi:hypothetical protein